MNKIIPRPWHSGVSVEFARDAAIRLSGTKRIVEQTMQDCRKIRGELLAIECRTNRVREWHNAIFASARGLAPTRHVLPWAECVSGPLDQLWREAEVRLARWAK